MIDVAEAEYARSQKKSATTSRNVKDVGIKEAQRGQGNFGSECKQVQKIADARSDAAKTKKRRRLQSCH